MRRVQKTMSRVLEGCFQVCLLLVAVADITRRSVQSHVSLTCKIVSKGYNVISSVNLPC